MHASSGQQKKAWEHPFCIVWGNGWGAKLDSCGSLGEWMDYYRRFAATLYEVWSLPGIHQPGQQPKPMLTIKLPSATDDVPPLLPNPKEALWGSRQSRIWIQTDNQQLDELFSGSSQLDQLQLRPLCVTIARRLYNLLEAGYRPTDDIANFVEWDLRQYNAVADHAANCALALSAPWAWKDDQALQHARHSKSNLRMCIDGARKSSGRSAGGMVVYGYQDSGDKVLLYRAGVDFGTLSSAFLAEAMALEWALDIFFSIVLRT